MDNHRTSIGPVANLLRTMALGAVCLALQGCFSSFSMSDADITLAEPVAAPHAMKTGWEYMDQRAFGAAIQAFRVELSNDAENESLRFGLAEAYRYAGYSQQAESRYAELLESVEFRSQALTGIGHLKLSNYDADGAFEIFSTAVAEDEAAWKAWLGLAQLRDLAGDWDAADAAYKRALLETTNRAVVLNNHGVSMMARGEPQAALAYLDMAASIASDDVRIRTNIDLAQAMSEEAPDLDREGQPDSKVRARIFNNRGYVAMLNGRHADAENYFNAAIDTHPSFYAVAHKNLRTLKTNSAKPR